MDIDEIIYKLHAKHRDGECLRIIAANQAIEDMRSAIRGGVDE